MRKNTTLVNAMVHTIRLQSFWQSAKYHFSQCDGTHNTAPMNLAMRKNTTLVNEMVHTIRLQSFWQSAKYHFSQCDGTHNTAPVNLAVWGQNTTLVNAMLYTILHAIQAVITQYCSSHLDTVEVIKTLLVNSSANLATWHEIKESCKH